MNVLITGGYGFIGSFIAERFYKENHSIFIIDNLSTGKKENVPFKHRSLICDIEDEEKCEKFFRNHSIDIVVHCAAQTKVQLSVHEPLIDSSTNILGLINLLHLSQIYKVTKFVFCSSAAVYGNNVNTPLKENESLNPISPYGISKMMGETYCQKWEQLYGVSSLIFRLSNVYGPRQHLSQESSVISTFTNQVLSSKPITVYSDGEQTRDFIYVGDIADAIFRSVMSELSGIYNLSTGTEISINELVNEFSRLHPVADIKRIEKLQDNISRSSLDNSSIKAQLDWVPMYSLSGGLQKVIDFYKEEKAPIDKQSEQKDEVVVTKRIPFLSFIENIVLFILFWAGFYFITPMIDTVDLWIIYVLLTALMFNKSQMVLAAFLAIGVQFYDLMSEGRIWTSLFLDNSILATLTIYLLVGFIVSYKSDHQKIELQFTRDELESAKSKYSFLSKIYEDTLQVKEELREQILRSEDGIGVIYQSVKELDNLEPEVLFNGAIHVLEKTLKARKFAIYLTNPNGYMRLAVKSNDPGFQPAISIKLEQGSLSEKALHFQKILFNMSLDPVEPSFVSPIVQNNETIALIICYDVDFDRLTLSYRNLVDVTSRLISSSLQRAYDYINEINKERYIEDTNALKPTYFKRMLENKQKGLTELNLSFIMLQMETRSYSIQELSSIGSLLRVNDYYGYDEKGELYILLSNVQKKDAQFVINRLKQQGLYAFLTEEEAVYAG
ncbi:NAD-dependent epimerase/dehydratase family protein [Robertmurraya korlensis]|uniref:NAD-dependent epimerase/dehydratase family protein n=1 Tax=Robertmurraya korlensis TaxID=519977 RepID=UPI000825F125|nr:NAD-dependent epimerase/dehydratase family protein [Robertmurraya korlensis]